MAANTQQEPTDLGKDVERAIEEFWLNCQQHGDPKKLAMIDCAPCRLAKGFLESAIRARIDERPEPTKAAEPEQETLESIVQRAWPKDAPIVKLREIAQLLMDLSMDSRSREVQLGRWLEYHLNRLDAPPHECWCKETHSGHAQCFKVGRHRCGCGATRPYQYEGMPGYDKRYDFWTGGLSGRPDARAATVAAIEDETPECKPQHDFTRHRVGDRTSEHSAAAQRLDHALHRLPLVPFLERFPKIAKIGKPVKQGERQGLTIVTALDFKALAEIVDVLVAERNAKL